MKEINTQINEFVNEKNTLVNLKKSKNQKLNKDFQLMMRLKIVEKKIEKLK
jgi:hypothetical protein